MAQEVQAEGTGLSFHPLDQFIVRPLFPAHSDVVSVDGSGLGGGAATLANGSIVPLDAEQIAAFNSGSEVSVDLWAAGLQDVHWYTITNAAMWMAIAVLAIFALFVLGTSRRALIPGRVQSMAELLYGFVHKMVEDVAGRDGLRYFPYVLTLFLFILFVNFLGLIPTSFSPTSQIAVTAVLGFGVFLGVTFLGFVLHGMKFLGLFWMSDSPLVLRPVIAVIELISYFVRPVSHSIRLAGNITAGHAMIKVFAGFAAIPVIAPASVVAITAIYGLEVLVAGIQAYVFTILTCVYLKDALHPGH